MENYPHNKRREQDQAKSEQENGPQVRFEVMPGGEPSCSIEQRRQEKQKDEVGINVNSWESRH